MLRVAHSRITLNPNLHEVNTDCQLPIFSRRTNCYGERIKANKANVLILNGSYLDADNKAISAGELMESFASFFDKMMNGIVDTIGLVQLILCCD